MKLKIIFLLISLLVFLIPFDQGNNTKFFILTFLLSGYNILELRRTYLRQPKYFLISPIFLSTIVTFGLVFGGIVNFLMIAEGQYIVKGFGYKIKAEPEWLDKAMLIACIASASTWLGYYSGLGSTMHKKFISIPLYEKIFSSEIDYKRLLAVTIFAYLIKFYLFGIGLYGRIVSEEYFEGVTGFKEGSQIRILGDLSYITFFFISIWKFKDSNPRSNLLFGASLAFELFFGFIYGARSAFITPFLILFIAFYYVKQRISLLTVGLVLGATYLAFTLVLDFKNYVLSKDFSRSSNSVELISNFNERQNRFVETKSTGYQFNSTLNTTLVSVTFVPETAVSIRQKDKFGMDGLTNPDILTTILKFPFDAFIPRFIQGQNEYPWGFWFKEEVIEMNIGLKYSIAMSPIGFLYMGGGTILVILGFWFYGVLLKFAYPFLTRGNSFSVLIYMLLLSSLYNLDSIYSNTLIYITRYLFIYSIVFWLVFNSQPFNSIRAKKISTE